MPGMQPRSPLAASKMAPVASLMWVASPRLPEASVCKLDLLEKLTPAQHELPESGNLRRFSAVPERRTA